MPKKTFAPIRLWPSCGRVLPGVKQVLSVTKAPVAATHSGIKAIVNVGRNLSDEELELIHNNRGVMQIVAFSNSLRPAPDGAAEGKPAPPATVAQLVDSIDYAVKKIRIDHVGISSDFNYGGGGEGGAMKARRKT